VRLDHLLSKEQKARGKNPGPFSEVDY
jgi:hypothetical protein